MQYCLDCNDQQQEDINEELVGFNKEMDGLRRELDKKIEQEDLQKIWKHFDRFSLYDDLKVLYGKVIPEIAKFEQKIMGFNCDIEKQNLILREFDSNLAQKTNKVALSELISSMEENYILKKDNQ